MPRFPILSTSPQRAYRVNILKNNLLVIQSSSRHCCRTLHAATCIPMHCCRTMLRYAYLCLLQDSLCCTCILMHSCRTDFDATYILITAVELLTLQHTYLCTCCRLRYAATCINMHAAELTMLQHILMQFCRTMLLHAYLCMLQPAYLCNVLSVICCSDAAPL